MRSYGHRQRRSYFSWLRGLRISIGIALLAALLMFEDAQARDDLVPGSRYTPAQAEAMGDAYLPLATDPASALFYNPAALAQNKGVHGSVFNLELYGDQGYFSAFNQSRTGFYHVTNLGSYVPTLQKAGDSWQGVGYSLIPAFYVKGIAFGVLVQENVRARYNSGKQTVDYHGDYNLIPAVGGALNLAEGIVRVGYSMQWVNEAIGSVNGVPAASATGYNAGLQKGSGLSSTLGLAITLPYQHLPQFDIVARNLFGTRYNSAAFMPFSSGGNGTPASEQTTIDTSLKFVEKIGRGAEFTWVFEDRDAMARSGVSLLGRAAVGMQFDFRKAFYLRLGYGDGYPDFGVGFKRQKSELSLTWSSTEIGNGYHDRRDTRYVLQYQIRTF